MEQHDWRNRRRNYFIKKEFQRNFIIKFCVLVILGSCISGTLIYLMSRSTTTTTFENTRLVMKSTADFILPAVLLSSAAVIVSIGLATIAVTLFTSHRIAGPLYRMEQDVREVASGNLTLRFHLRKGDEVKRLAESLDEMTQTLRVKIARLKEAVSALEAALGSPESPVGKDRARALEDRVRDLREVLDKFNV